MTTDTTKPFLTIRPPSGWAAINAMEVWHFRDLLFSLAGRDLKLRYKQTALGVAWVVLQPLLAAGIFTFVFGVVAGLPTNFTATYAGLLGWNLFATTLTKVSGCLVGNSHLISKVFFPRLVLPMSNIPSTMVDFAISGAIMVVLMILYGIHPHAGLFLLPFWLAILLALAMGLGLWAAALTVSYRDVQYIIPVFTQMLLYASPVGYTAVIAVERLSKWLALHNHPASYANLYFANPLASPLEGIRWSLLGGDAPQFNQAAYSAIIAVACLIIGAIVFKRMERKFADVI